MYTKINLHHTYYIVWVVKGDKWKTAFCTQYRSFKWVVMTFGLTNALAAFQWFINDIFLNLFNVCIVVYLNNILIYLDNMF